MREFLIIGPIWIQNSRSRQTTEPFYGAQNSIYCQRDQFSTAVWPTSIYSFWIFLTSYRVSFFGSTWRKEFVWTFYFGIFIKKICWCSGNSEDDLPRIFESFCWTFAHLLDISLFANFFRRLFESFLQHARSAHNRLATIRIPYAGPTTGLKSAKCRLYECRLLADFRPVVGPAYGSRMVANQIRADRVVSITFVCWWVDRLDRKKIRFNIVHLLEILAAIIALK
jgi:hypothetical protein